MSDVVSYSADKALEVLRLTVGQRPDSAWGVQTTGARLVSMLSTVGWSQQRALSARDIVQLSGVIAAIDVLSQDIGKTTFRMYRRLPNGGKEEVMANEHWLALLLKTEPNRFHTWPEFFEMVMLHMALSNNSFIAKRFASRYETQVEELLVCMPGRTRMLAVSPDDDAAGRGFYCYEVYRGSPQEEVMLAGLPGIFLEHEMIHLRSRSFDGLAGFSNLEAGAKTFGFAHELMEYQTRLYRNDGQLRGVFSKPGTTGDTLSEEAFERLRDQLSELMRTFRRDNRPIVLEEGMEFKHISMTADQAELSKLRDAAVVDTARQFRIPPHKLMHLVNVKYENMETLEKSYVQDSLIPHARRIETKFERSMLTPKERGEFFLQFDRQEMLLNDSEKVADAIETQGKLGAITLDEIRAAFGNNPLPKGSGKVRPTPSTYNLVGEDNVVVIAAGGAAPDEASTEAEPAKKPKKSDVDEDDEKIIPLFPVITVGEK